MAVDINSIPAAAIARVETITGGASSVYGADAVAGEPCQGADGERVEQAFQLIRDLLIFTDRRVILVDRQGVVRAILARPVRVGDAAVDRCDPGR